MTAENVKSHISNTKKIMFSIIVFTVFVIMAEFVLSFTPAMMGFTQRGDYDDILSGGSAIICLGDSVTYGYDVDTADSWPAQIQAILNENQSNMRVVNRGESGMDSSTILQREVRTIESISDKNIRPIVLLMAGHNDLMGIGWKKWQAHDGTGAKIDQGQTQPPRLFRMLKWLWHTHNLPENASWIKPEAKATLLKNIISLNDAIGKRNGKLYVMTYLLPGDATGILRPNAAKEIAKSREYQGIGNQILRTVASEHNIALIDIEKYAEAPSKWDDNWFMDHIHPTTVGHKAIAETTLKWLSAYGELPINMNHSD